jgi:hypothetical protein
MTLGFNWQYLIEFLNNVGAIQGAASVSEPGAAAAGSVEGDEGAANGEASATARAKQPSSPTRIDFSFKDQNGATQMSISGETAYNYKYIVMPLRI